MYRGNRGHRKLFEKAVDREDLLEICPASRVIPQLLETLDIAPDAERLPCSAEDHDTQLVVAHVGDPFEEGLELGPGCPVQRVSLFGSGNRDRPDAINQLKAEVR